MSSKKLEWICRFWLSKSQLVTMLESFTWASFSTSAHLLTMRKISQWKRPQSRDLVIGKARKTLQKIGMLWYGTYVPTAMLNRVIGALHCKQKKSFWERCILDNFVRLYCKHSWVGSSSPRVNPSFANAHNCLGLTMKNTERRSIKCDKSYQWKYMDERVWTWFF